MTISVDPHKISIASVQMHLRNVILREGVTIDEVHLFGADVEIDLPEAGASGRVQTGETKFEVMMSEININALLTANIPADAPVRGLRIALLLGKVRCSGQYPLAVVHVPFSLDAVPVIENGIRVRLDCKSATVGQASTVGISLPGAVVELIEQHINRSLSLDLSRAPFPVHLDGIRCEPGRLTVTGHVRFSWPPSTSPPTPAPFTPGELPPSLSEVVQLPASESEEVSRPSLKS